MRYFCGFLILVAIAVSAVSASAQKGVDSQTQTIKEDANKATSRTADASRSFDWGKGKTRVRERLPNPYQLNSRRDVLLQTIKDVLAENRLVMDEASSRLSEGIIVDRKSVV